jgi:RNA polymerase sigma-70 factor (ECF subfamily)
MAVNNFQEMIVDSAPFLHRVALKLTRNNDQARDLVQDTLLRALRNHSKFSEGSQLEAWLYTILRNSFINFYRKQQHRKKTDRQLEKQGWHVQGNHQQNEGVSRLLMKSIHQKLEDLPAPYRKALKLRMAGYQYAEISEITGEPLGTTKSRIHFAKLRLKKMLVEMAD